MRYMKYRKIKNAFTSLKSKPVFRKHVEINVDTS